MCPKLEILNLNFRQTRGFDRFEPFGTFSGFEDFGDNGIFGLANGRCQLSKVFLRRRKNVGNYGVISLVEYMRNLTHLDLGRCNLINDESLVAIGKVSSIRVLNLEGCSLISDCGLASLANGSSSRTLKELVLAECYRITDSGVSLLQHIHCLEGLNLAQCGPKVTDFGVMALASIQTLKRLNLSWLIKVSDITLVALAENCRDLLALDLTGCELITGAGIRAFAYHECLEALVLASCYNIDGDDLDLLLRCKSLRSIVLDRELRMWMPAELQEKFDRLCELHWI
ncbi:F-box/LRR-repeat protein 7-like [Tripterygium wilfordii]|uniref:F-box/LRR-repeat protein 7-like n=2 Tax=Tripterygium wilfordii TaxID=458696 RepID=A0A7J7DAB5_TRIWF|nr:F-box/LRR-repeat protein 4-like isoform X2 [Tripterygium wilfordii]XP_038711711.1 F-box/LRR-repeat protein 4-like isoform X2 [Tripterygium wilfordii]XP_038711712.1 F-box/LRR-repeat protein 4-like isoform X2 [Tripterygium wilfordii]KAF5743241.1 F-box/LRR-repeat protein 7-like [Tripterygium wilfordii]